jgi:hypothetical protein
MAAAKNVLDYFSLECITATLDIDMDTQFVQGVSSFHIVGRDIQNMLPGKYFFSCHTKQCCITSVTISHEAVPFKYNSVEKQSTEIASFASRIRDIDSYEYCQKVHNKFRECPRIIKKMAHCMSNSQSQHSRATSIYTIHCNPLCRG